MPKYKYENNHHICKSCGHTEVCISTSNIWPDCKIYKCTHCNTYWYICEVHNQRFARSQFSKMNSHFKNIHAGMICRSTYQQTSMCCKTGTDIVSSHDKYKEDIISNNIRDDFSVAGQSNDELMKNDISMNTTSTDNVGQFKHITNTKYFCDESNETNSGICGLIGRAFQLNSNSTTCSSLQEAKFHMDLCDFVMNLTDSRKHQLIRILNSTQSTNFLTTRIPRTIQDLRSYYTTNKHSILGNMPIPHVFELDNHACVSIKSLIAHVLALRNIHVLLKSSTFSTMEIDNTTLLSTNKVYHILKEVYDKYKHEIDPFVLFVVIWSDDFEVNRTRKNKSSTWLKTLTFVSSVADNKLNDDTYAICLSMKKLKHDCVNKMFNDELEDLAFLNEFYVRSYNQEMPIVVRVLVMSADRPERNALNDLLSHTGTSSKRWMYSSLVDPYKLASCDLCYQYRLFQLYSNTPSREINHDSCNKCCDFNYIKPNNKQTYFRLPKNHPYMRVSPSAVNQYNLLCPHKCTEICGNEKKLPSSLLTYSALQNALRYAIYNLLCNNWTKPETIAYLKVWCVKEERIQLSITYAKEALASGRCVMTIVNDLPMPSMWTGILSLDQFVDTPMHLLFEGIVKSGIELIIQFMKYHKKWNKLVTVANHYLDEVHYLCLDYCKCEAFTNDEDYKPGGWLAETYLGFSRIMVIIVIQIDTFIDGDTVGIQHIKLLIASMFAMLSRLMTTDNVAIDIIEHHIKLFLSICHYFEGEIGYPTNNDGIKLFPFWFNRGNFVSLLNLPKQIDMYGPVRLHWEGSKERYIQRVKPILVNNRSSGTFLLTKMKWIHSLSTFEAINNNICGIVTRDTNVTSYNGYNIYKDREALLYKLDRYDVISGIVISQNQPKIYILVHRKGQIIALELLCLDNGLRYKMNLPFWQISLSSHPTYVFDNRREIEPSIMDNVILLPCDITKTCIENGYIIITANWKYMSPNKTLQFYNPSLTALQKMKTRK